MCCTVETAAKYSTNQLLKKTTEDNLLNWALGSNFPDEYQQICSEPNNNQLLQEQRSAMEVDSVDQSENVPNSNVPPAGPLNSPTKIQVV